MAPEFAHRMNLDGTTDSICPRCYVTVCNSRWQMEMERMETGHVCDTERLAYFDAGRSMFGKPVSSHHETP